MGVQLTKNSIDLGIVTTDPDRALAFYRDTLGFEPEGEMPLPGGGKMHRLLCGTSLIKIVVNAKEPPESAPKGGLAGATGYRYWTMSVSNLEEIVKACSDGGYNVPIPVREVRPGVRIAMVEDPDGNWVEFLEN